MKISRLLNSIILFSSFLFLPCNAFAQEQQPVGPFEFEISAGLTMPLGGYHGGSNHVGALIGMEGRYNFANLPISVGGLLDLTTAVHEYPMVGSTNFYEQSNRTLSLAVVADYNFNRGRSVSVFAGGGLGYAFNDCVGDVRFNSAGSSMAFIPRCGVELFNWVRITFSSHISRHGYNNASISIGLCLGGQPKAY